MAYVTRRAEGQGPVLACGRDIGRRVRVHHRLRGDWGECGGGIVRGESGGRLGG